mgnify:CR=1 FL=1
MKKKMIAAGHICVDITPAIPGKKVTKINELMIPGKLIEVGDATVSTGGAVANTGLAMKVLGANVSLMGKIGNDAFGGIVKSVLKKYGAEDELLISDTEGTSYTLVVAVPGIDRIFLHNPGANNSFCTEDIPVEELKDAALFHFGYPTIMRSMYLNDGEELVKMMKMVKEAGVATSMDLASVDEASEAATVDWHLVLERVMPYIDIFVPSVEELCYMLDKERFQEWQKRAAGKDITEVLDIEKDVKPLAQECMKLGAKILLLKCGVPGMYFCSADKEVLSQISDRLELDVDAWAGKEYFEKSYVPERVLSGTGAGDTSIAAFLTAMTDGYTPEDALHLAAGTGASCVTAYDALSGLKTFEELKKKIDAGWEKVK